MKVYIVMHYTDYDCGEILGVYKTREGAQKKIDTEIENIRIFDYDDEDDDEWIEEMLEGRREEYSIETWIVKD